MLDINELNKTINYLQTLKNEEQNKRLEKLNEVLKEEITKTIENSLIHFESDEFVKFKKENGIDVCYDFNFNDIMEKLKETIKVDIWEIK